MFKSLKWEDWLGIVVGAWLLVSPWTLGFADQPVPTMNALVMGTFLILEELLDLGVHETVEEWIDLGAGLWLIVSPFVLDFASQRVAATSTIAVGVVTVVLAALALSPLDTKLGHWWHVRVRH